MISGNSAYDTLPDDVFLIVFSLLEVTDLLKCVQVCCRFRRLVKTDTSLQYKIELVKSGMVDGPADAASMGTGDRLYNLRAYNARLHRGEYTGVQDCSFHSDAGDVDEASWERVWSTGGSVAYVARKAGGRELVLSVPPVSHVDGVRRGRNMVVPLDVFGPDVLVATDYTQDLLVGVSKHIEDCSDFQIHVGSLDDGKLGHPMAAETVLGTSAFDLFVQHAPADVHALRIYSQYVFLVVLVDRMGPYEFQVWNWMTGTPLMKTIVTATGTPRFTLIDNAHFAVIGSRDTQISVYRFAHDGNHAASPGPRFKLTLPGADVRLEPNMPPVFFFIQEISVSLPLPPSVHDLDNSAAFAMNPDSAVLIIDFTTATGLASGSYVLLVPTSSLRAAMRDVYNSSQPNASLDWGEWGSGALLLHKCEPEPDASWIYPVAQGRPYGSRMPVLVYPKGTDTTIGQILIIEMDPWASRHARRRADVEEGRGEPAMGAIASLREHVRLDLYGHRLRPNYTVYRGPLIPLPSMVEPDELVLDEHGVSILYAGPGDHNNDRMRRVETWALV